MRIVLNFLLIPILFCVAGGCSAKSEPEPIFPPTSGTLGSITWEYAAYMLTPSGRVVCHVLKLSGSGDMPDFEEGAAPWAIYASETEHILFYGDRITHIGAWAFAHMPKITTVAMPNYLIDIGHHAFANCTALSAISLGHEVIGIDKYAFSNCPSLITVFCDADSPPWFLEGNFEAEGDTLYVNPFDMDPYLAEDPYGYRNWSVAFTNIKSRFDYPD